MKSEEYTSRSENQYDLIVFCHLRWDFVYQRPQHLVSRLGETHKILVVEEPIHFEVGENSKFNVRMINAQIDICQPQVENHSEIGNYLKKFLKNSQYAVGWFYSAAFVSVLDTLQFETIVYDCMDELSLFKGASSQLTEQENKLLALADIVYTGGKSLYEAKKEKHSNVFCFPSSVNVNHFSITNASRVKPEDMLDIPSPIVGYYGVIDERIDLNLIRDTASKCPDVSFVMIGPLAKIEDQDLPRAANIFYLGMKTYQELPNYLAHFDIAMMPFALNDSTKYISPTKTLEYMSAYKPIISTRIRDVERDYGNCVMLIDDANEFVQAIINPMRDFKDTYQKILHNTSWDTTAKEMGSMLKKIMV